MMDNFTTKKTVLLKMVLSFVCVKYNIMCIITLENVSLYMKVVYLLARNPVKTAFMAYYALYFPPLFLEYPMF